MMKLDVKNIVFAPEGESQNFSVDFSKKIDEEVLAESISGEVTVTNLEGMLLCSFDLNVKIKLACDRCLAEFEVDKNIKFKQEYLLSPNAEEDSPVVAKDDKIEIEEPIVQEISSGIPVKKLCKIDCKGICSSCGEDLNVKKCKCRN